MPDGLCCVAYAVWPTPHGLCRMACVVWPMPHGLRAYGPVSVAYGLCGVWTRAHGIKQKQISEPVLVGGLAPMAKQGQACPRQRRVLPPSEACHPGHQSQNLYNGVGSKSALQTGVYIGFRFSMRIVLGPIVSSNGGPEWWSCVVTGEENPMFSATAVDSALLYTA